MSSTQPADHGSLPPAVTPRAVLLPRHRRAETRTWDTVFPDARDIPSDIPSFPTEGLWKLTGQAGSGISSYLIDTAVNAIAADPAGAAARGVLIVTASKESASSMRAELSDRLASTGFITHEPVVRSVHSLAFGLLRQQTKQSIRLISGAEQDAVIRQLLLGQAEDGRGGWPDELRPALTMVGFARQLRDFLLRAVERGMSAEDLRQLGFSYGVPMWVAASEFLREYEQVMALTGTLRYSASELVSKVLEHDLAQTWGIVLVDDAQHLAPASSRLLIRLLERARLGVVGGDLRQSVFRFRGASPHFYQDLGGLEHTVLDLGPSRRRPHRAVVIAPDVQTHHAVIVDTLRRAHFEDGVAFGDMAVIVRSTPMIEPLRRSLLHAGVPVTLDPTDVVLAQQRIVISLLLGLRAINDDLSTSEWRELLLGPVGGTDPVTLRRLLRGLRRAQPDQRAEDTMRELLSSSDELPEFGTVLTERELSILQRIRKVLDQGRQTQANGGSVEEVLWAIWSATGLSDRLLASALRGGATGSQADRDLDAVMALFDAAGDFTERRPTAGVESFVAFITEQQLPTGVRDRRVVAPDAVALLTAHGAAGQEYERVIVAGVQETSWPSLSETGTIFRQEDLVDLVDDGIDPDVPVSHTAERLNEERNLFHVAATRATQQLLVTAVDGVTGDDVLQPSRFVDEFAAAWDLTPQQVAVAATPHEQLANEQAGASAGEVRVLARDDIVAELRQALQSPSSSEASRGQAARQLARLTEAGVPGASQTQWWGGHGASTRKQLRRPAALSPSRIESLLQCPMRAVLERMAGLDETLEMIHGQIAHAYLEALGKGIDPATARQATMAARQRVQRGPAWKRARDIEDFASMLDRLDAWLASSRSLFDQVAVEATVDVQVDAQTRIAGRIDRLEREKSGALHIVDLKTGAHVPTKQDTEHNAQLTAYQLAVSRGKITGNDVVTNDGTDPIDVGGALLIYPNANKSGFATREQAPKPADDLETFAEAIRPLSELMRGPQLPAHTGEHCDNCRVRALCPVQPEGRTIQDG